VSSFRCVACLDMFANGTMRSFANDSSFIRFNAVDDG
jgi:hypothetical protein